MQFYINGKWSDGSATINVTNPFDQSVVDTVPAATESEVDQAIGGAVDGFQQIKSISAYERAKMLRKAATLLAERIDTFAETISKEEGKTIRESRGETQRAIETLELSAEEAKRLGGEVLPLSGASGTEGKLGITLRVPCGVVAAITPFNFPLNLVCHKVGPALAAGNSVILKPASDTPLTSLLLVKVLLDAGCPDKAITCVTGSGGTVGDALCRDSRIRKISFTGSKEVGESICKSAGLKRVTMELGANSPLIVMPDADMRKVIAGISISGFANAGQVCISAQRVIVHRDVHEQLLEELVPRVSQMKAGDPFADDSRIGPMVRESDAQRVESWINDAVGQGAKLHCGGERDAAMVTPAVLSNVDPTMQLVQEELFGPAVGILQAESMEDAIEQANASPYGLSAAIFTKDVDQALKFAHHVDSGNIHINWGPVWRTDLMPYGGVKESGFGKEGPRYAIDEMTEMKTVIFHSDF